jgi:Protein of unknown function (DUF1761)
MPLGEVNYLSVLVAAVAAWFFGALWYTVFSKAWIAARGTTMEQLKAEGVGRSAAANAFPFLLSFIAELIMGTMLYGILTHANAFSLRGGLISAALIWIGFVLTTLWVNNAYQMRKLMLSVIDGGHWLGVLLIMGAIIGVMGR